MFLFIWTRRSQLVLVDELAHTNAPGSRHPKRYQDVEELIEAGLNVYATLNIQHIESLRSVVAQITGVWVRETVPDSVIDNVDEVELVDLPPDELLQRLREGKVYVPEMVGRAIEDFFRKGNLTALRELTLRTAVQRVDEQVRAYMGTHAIRGPWPTGERILVCISHSPVGPDLVRAARRLAGQLGAEWTALHVETQADLHLSPSEQERLADVLKMARELGGKIVTLQGNLVAPAVMDGIKVTRLLRQWMQTPIIILSVRGSAGDKIAALDAGADDYLTKPFGIGELLARLRAALRRISQPSGEPVFKSLDLTVDLMSRKVNVGQKEVKLTPTEYGLLHSLVVHADKVLTHHYLLKEVWGAEDENEFHLLHVNISNLRRKIESDPAQPKLIITEPGVGYMLKSP